MNVLITCPPMLGMIDVFSAIFSEKNIHIDTPKVIQTLTEKELINILPNYDGWIIGDDPATEAVLASGKAGKLKAAVKWGIGIDNVDFDAAKKLNIPIINTPNMFGAEVADIALAYIIGLARELYWIDRQVWAGSWPKPSGISLKDKVVGVIGYGDIGKQLSKRLLALDMQLIIYDPAYSQIQPDNNIRLRNWALDIEKCDFLVFTCALNKNNYHLFNIDILNQCKKGVRIINVARGGLIDESVLIGGLEDNKIHSVALDVMETEPLPINSKLRKFERCIFGSHNASNTKEAVYRTSIQAINKLFDFLNIES